MGSDYDDDVGGGRNGPFFSSLTDALTPEGFNSTTSAFISTLADRQLILRGMFGFPMTLFVGPGVSTETTDASDRGSRGEQTSLSKYRRIAFTSDRFVGGFGSITGPSYWAEEPPKRGKETSLPLDTKGFPWVAIATLPEDSTIRGRSPIIFVWSNFMTTVKNDDDEKYLSVLRGKIGADVRNTWRDKICKLVLSDKRILDPPLSGGIDDKMATPLNVKELYDGDSKYVMSTGSPQAHSVLWPLAQMTVLNDDRSLNDTKRLHTRYVAGEEGPSTDWTKTLKLLSDVDLYHRKNNSGGETTTIFRINHQEYAWFAWTMGILLDGNMPFLRHTIDDNRYILDHKAQLSRSEEAPISYAPLKARPHLTREKFKDISNKVVKRNF
jgi:hypothetical protein